MDMGHPLARQAFPAGADVNLVLSKDQGIAVGLGKIGYEAVPGGGKSLIYWTSAVETEASERMVVPDQAI